jgi:hypothetical protein
MPIKDRYAHTAVAIDTDLYILGGESGGDLLRDYAMCDINEPLVSLPSWVCVLLYVCVCVLTSMCTCVRVCKLCRPYLYTCTVYLMVTLPKILSTVGYRNQSKV